MDGNEAVTVDELVIEFIRKEGPVTTYSISTRFGWDMRDTRKVMNRLRDQGRVTSKREIIDWGAINGWRISDE